MSTVGGGGRGRWWRCELIMTNDCLILFIFLLVSRFWLNSVPVYSGEHSGLNSGMPIDTHDLRPPAKNVIVVCRTASPVVFRKLPPSSVALPHLPSSSAVIHCLLPLPTSIRCFHRLPPPSDTFRPIVRSRKSRFRNEPFPYVHVSSMPCRRRLVSFRAAAVV